MDTHTLATIFDPNSPFLLSAAIISGFFKTLFLIGFGVYVVFAFAVIRQVVLMTRTLQTALNVPLILFTWIHFLLAILVWVFAFVVL